MLWVYTIKNCFNFFDAEIHFRRQNMTFNPYIAGTNFRRQRRQILTTRVDPLETVTALYMYPFPGNTSFSSLSAGHDYIIFLLLAH